MKTKITQNYILQEDRGTLLRTGGPGSVIVTDDNEPELVEVDTLEQVGKRVGKRRLKPIEQLRVRTDSGEIDTEATESAIASHYSEYYQNLMDIAVDWDEGLKCERKQTEPVRYDGKLYEVEQTHTVVDPNHTPDVTASLYTEIIAPTPGLDCPEFVQPTSTRYYNKGDCVAYNGYYYESLINVNTYSPDQYAQGWEKIGPI